MNSTDITIIVDRSGSMMTCNIETQNGINKFVEDQAKEKGKCNFSLVQFDDVYEVVHAGVKIKDVPKYELVPRSMTALNDAVCKTIIDTKSRVGKKKPLVIIVIATDGGENASHEFKRSDVKRMINEQQEKGWQFTFIGANQDAFAEGATMGIAVAATANYNTANTEATYGAASASVSRSRTAHSVGGDASLSYTKKERKGMTDSV